MLHYLDGVDNIAGNPNENYSRELQELHALSVDGGYTPNDVKEVARAFTGWTVSDNAFACAGDNHDSGSITLDLGKTPVTLSESEAQASCTTSGDWVLDRLAEHPSTHEFICEKLTQLFVNDDPPASIVSDCVSVFGTNVEGSDQIALAVEAILSHSTFVDALDYLDKVKTPLELEVGFVRNFGLPASGGLGDLAAELEQMSMRLFGRSPPDGYPEVAEDWVNSELILQRFRFIADIAFNTSTNDIFVDPVDFFSVRHGKNSAVEIVDFLLDLALANEHGTVERDQALAILNAGSPFDIGATDATQKLRRLLAAVLNHPGYQFQ